LVIVGVTVLALWFGRSRSNLPETALMPAPLTSYPGFQTAPTFSPDGNQVAFCWDGEKRDNKDIYVKLIGGGPPLRLTCRCRELRPG
jgi:Tol biopolymer transport system component